MHHSNNAAHQAVNLGGVTLLWDHLLRTYCAPQDGVVYGVADTPATTSYLGVYLDPWRRG
jgi:sterol desaturase/sphingolipid hydroxylase (fatty acid hydroxylase superfamily)